MNGQATGWWSRVDPAAAPGDAPVAFCADLSADSLLGAYRHGLFPLPAADEYGQAMNEARYEHLVADGTIAVPAADGAAQPAYRVAWWSPDPRPVIPTDGARLGRRLSRRLRRSGWTTTADHAFERVVELCAQGREPRWLTAELRDGLGTLHSAGYAHSSEVWDGAELVGGVFGIRVGPVLSLDSMFHRRPNAARVAVADLAARFAATGGRHLDAQWDSPHVRALGAHPIPRDHYLTLLAAGPPTDRPPRDRLPASRLARHANS